MASRYGVEDIFTEARAAELADAYSDMVTEQIDNAEFRDMYMETMETTLNGNTHDLGGFEDPASESLTELDVPDMEGCGSCAKECGSSCGGQSCESDLSDFDNDIVKTLCNIPESDPTDAATFFNITGQKPSVESMQLAQEMNNLISAVVPDTDIVCASEAMAYTNDDDYGTGMPSFEGAGLDDDIDLGDLDIGL
jgi:hypothetical protein